MRYCANLFIQIYYFPKLVFNPCIESLRKKKTVWCLSSIDFFLCRRYYVSYDSIILKIVGHKIWVWGRLWITTLAFWWYGIKAQQEYGIHEPFLCKISYKLMSIIWTWRPLLNISHHRPQKEVERGTCLTVLCSLSQSEWRFLTASFCPHQKVDHCLTAQTFLNLLAKTDYNLKSSSVLMESGTDKIEK